MIANKNFLPVDDQSEFEVGRARAGGHQPARRPSSSPTGSRRASADDVSGGRLHDGDRGRRLGAARERGDDLRPPGAARASATRDVFAVIGRDPARSCCRSSRRPACGRRCGRSPTMGGGGQQNARSSSSINGPDLETARRSTRSGSSPQTPRRSRRWSTWTPRSTPASRSCEVTLDRAKAADLGVQIERRGRRAAAARRRRPGDDLQRGRRAVRGAPARRCPATAGRSRTSGSLTVPSSRLGSVPLDNLATFEPGEAPVGDPAPEPPAAGDACSRACCPGVGQTAVMDAHAGGGRRAEPRAASTVARFAGRSRELGRAGQDFLLAFGLSLVFMYLILAAQFESWLHPITILLSLPLTLPFALLSIIVDRAVAQHLLGARPARAVRRREEELDPADRPREPAARRTGWSVHEAIIQASRDRLRPILMTTLSFVAGHDSARAVERRRARAPTARSGSSSSAGRRWCSSLTLVVTPVAYSLFDDASKLGVWTRAYECLVAPGGRVAARVKPAGAAGAGLAAGAGARRAGRRAGARAGGRLPGTPPRRRRRCCA